MQELFLSETLVCLLCVLAFLGRAQAGAPVCFDSAFNLAVTNRSIWMQVLYDSCPTIFRNRALNEISLPGSHDAGSYRSGLTDDSACSSFLGANLCHKWFITQSGSIEAQLRDGSRYFDLRLHWGSFGDCEQDLLGVGGCWELWHPNAIGSYMLSLKVPGMNFAPLTDVVTQVKAFLLSHSQEIIILNFKLQQYVDKFFFWDDKAQKRLEVLQRYLQAELGEFVGNPAGSHWWSATVGHAIDNNKRLFFIIRGEGEDSIRKYSPWLASFWVDTCKGSKHCDGPMWKSGFPNKCCDVEIVLQDQAEKRKAAPPVTGLREHPLLRLAYQFTFQAFGNDAESLRHASYEIKLKMLEIFNDLVRIDQQVPANIMQTDFANDCPQSSIAFAVCGSVLPPLTPCNVSIACPPLSIERENLSGSNALGLLGFLLIVLMALIVCICWCCPRYRLCRLFCCRSTHDNEDKSTEEDEETIGDLAALEETRTLVKNTSSNLSIGRRS